VRRDAFPAGLVRGSSALIVAGNARSVVSDVGARQAAKGKTLHHHQPIFLLAALLLAGDAEGQGSRDRAARKPARAIFRPFKKHCQEESVDFFLIGKYYVM
jgi:hypothetical protein